MCGVFAGSLFLFLISLALDSGEAQAQSIPRTAAEFAHHLDGIDDLANLDLGQRVGVRGAGRPSMRCG